MEDDFGDFNEAPDTTGDNDIDLFKENQSDGKEFGNFEEVPEPKANYQLFDSLDNYDMN
jgi:hypothetical protein